MKATKQQRQRVTEDMKTLPAGTAVIVTKDDGSQFPTTTCSKPWQLGHGDWIVSVEGISGGYDLERVRRA